MHSYSGSLNLNHYHIIITLALCFIHLKKLNFCECGLKSLDFCLPILLQFSWSPLQHCQESLDYVVVSNNPLNLSGSWKQRFISPSHFLSIMGQLQLCSVSFLFTLGLQLMEYSLSGTTTDHHGETKENMSDPGVSSWHFCPDTTHVTYTHISWPKQIIRPRLTLKKWNT